MKTTDTCPKCNSKEIVRIEGKTGAFGAGNNVSLGATIFTSVKVTRYLCGSCGFSEEWIDSPQDLQKLKEEYRPS